MATKLHIDIETYSSVDIKESGAYKYIESPDFEILLIAFAFNDEPIQVIDLTESEITHQLIIALNDPLIEKHAHNAVFERRAFERIGAINKGNVEEWYCSAIKAAHCGLPLSLGDVSAAMGLGEFGKSAEGKALIKYFCCPTKGTKKDGYRPRNYPQHDPEKWGRFKEYCRQDVVAEREIDKRLEKYKISEDERANYLLDQKINDRGVKINKLLALNAIEIDSIFAETAKVEMIELTGVENPNSAAQLKEWLSDNMDNDVSTLAKQAVKDMLETASGNVKRVLELRQLLSKSSIKKYQSMLNCVCGDGRAHGLFQFYGANRTGRWAGRLIQLQNLPQNHLKCLEIGRNAVLNGDYEVVSMLYDNIPSLLSELIRTAFVPSSGKMLAVADFSAIEARVIAWLAGENWRLQVFNTHGKIYEASASMMFNVPIESVTKGSELRQKGKIAELALGYQGGVGAMKTMGGEQMGLSEEDMQVIVARWRKANPAIVAMWSDIESCAKQAIKTKKRVVSKHKGLIFECDQMALTIQLPSGRKLFYQSPAMAVNRFGSESIKYKGMNQETKQWGWVESYGGKLTENIVQAISRDLLCVAMQSLDDYGFDIIMHVHDEVVAEVEEYRAEEDINLMCMSMGEPVAWAQGLPLRADGYLTKYYKKD